MKISLSGLCRIATAAVFTSLIVACDNSSDAKAIVGPVEPVPPIVEPTYSAEIVWTEYGIPHVTAADWGGLGYGYGYAYARDNFCTLMREIVRANGDSARYFGEEGNLQEDLVYKLYNTDEYIREQFLAQEDFGESIAGFTQGVNRFLNETGVDNLAQGDEGCRGAEWVRALNDTDLGKLLRKLTLRASTERLAEFITAQDGPDDPMVVQARLRSRNGAPLQNGEMQIAGTGLLELLPDPERMGSNAYAIGGNYTVSGGGLLLGNPHFPWQGNERFYMVHLTIPGLYDVMGSSIHGFPLVNFGFNENVAWTHTVSTARRFTLFELTVDSSNPMKYVSGDQLRDIETRTVSAERKLADGSIESVEHTFYLTHLGPVLDLSGPTGEALLGDWPTLLGTIYVAHDVNLYNSRGFDTWAAMGMATSISEFIDGLKSLGNPWANIVAADRAGNAFYGDITAIPHVTQAQFDTCINGFIAPLLTEFGLVTLNGSDPACEWGSDDDAPAEGVFGYGNLPGIQNRDYTANANDSYWLSNPQQLLEGFSPIIGRERVEQSRRTRATFSQAENRIAGNDGLGGSGFDLDNIRELLYQSKNYTAELVLDDVIGICQAQEDNPLAGVSQVEEACNILAGWDRSHRIDSVGGHIFTEVWREMRGIPELFATPFDAADPINTPRDLNIDNPDVVAAVQDALVAGVERLSAAGIPLDRKWGEVQFDERNGERIPIHGGSGDMMFSVISSSLVDGSGYSNIRAGNSYIHAVGWDDGECPDAYAIVTYSQSTDPASDHYADATKLYSDSGWIDMPFCAVDIEAQEIGRMSISE
jgi:acyl-homoserine-lactone acylase